MHCVIAAICEAFYICTCMGPTLNERSEIQRFERSNTIERRDRIMLVSTWDCLTAGNTYGVNIYNWVFMLEIRGLCI